MFWGVTILGGRRYTQTVEKSYHISKAVLDVPVDGKVTGKRVQLMLEHNKSQYLLCNLDSDKTNQVDLDLIFTEGEEVTFYLNGDGPVHLSGYVLEFNDDFDEDDDELFDEESEDEEVESKSAKRMVKDSGDSLNQNAKRVKNDEPSAGFAATKKAKINGSIGDDDDDDEEDSDYALGNLDEEFDSVDEEDDEELDDEEDDEEEDEEDDEEEDEPKQVKPAPKVNGQAPKLQQQKGTPGQKGQHQGQGGQKNTPGGKPNNNISGKPNNTPGKPNNNQTPKGGQPNQNNKFGQNKGQNNSPLGQNKPNNNNQKGPQQQNQQKQGGQNNKAQQFNKQKGGSFTPDPKGAKKLPGGLQVNDVHVGSGPEAKKGKFVHVRYIGRLPNNKEFDRSTGKPFSFRLGAGEVIKGWEQGLEGMKVGGKRKIVVPPSLGYGNRSMGPIPANSTLHFDLELVSIS